MSKVGVWWAIIVKSSGTNKIKVTWIKHLSHDFIGVLRFSIHPLVAHFEINIE